MNYIPVNSRLLISPDPAREETAGGIYLPTNSRPKPQCGTVAAAGPGKRLPDGSRAEMFIKVGDRVMFQRYGGLEMEIGENTFLVLDEDDVLAVEKF